MRTSYLTLAVLLLAAASASAGGPSFTNDVTITGGDPDIVLTDNNATETDWEICLDDTGCNLVGDDGRDEAFHVKWVDGGTPQIPFIIENGSANYLLYLDAAENIGINTSTPGVPLTILDSNPEIHLDDTSMDAGEAFIQLSTNTLTLEGIGGVDIIEYDVRAPITMDIDETGVTTFLGDVKVNSSRKAKKAVTDVDGRQILEQLRGLSIHRWSYLKDDESVRHIGPMAEDFQEAFGLGQTADRISLLDASGIALAAIGELAARMESLEEENVRLRDELERVRAALP